MIVINSEVVEGSGCGLLQYIISQLSCCLSLVMTHYILCLWATHSYN